MLVLAKAGLVYLANPKTASQAIRAMLAPHSSSAEVSRDHPHMNAAIFARRFARTVQVAIGRPPETFAVMREPLDHMHSWFRYRQRDALRGHPNSTHGLSFAEFVEARLANPQPPFAAIGRQDRFLGHIGGGPPVTHIFDYARMDRLVAFLSNRLEVPLSLGERNISPKVADTPDLSAPLMARFRAVHGTELDLYAKVAAKGHLITR